MTEAICPKISPVPDGISRPYWSVMIPTFNCAKYLAQTLESILAQDPGPEKMQIEVVDDCSTKDNPEEVVNSIGKGRVKFYCQSKNLGATGNFNTCIERSVGEYVHILHGDDFVSETFHSEFQKMITANPEAALFACRAFHIDETGEIDVLSPRLLGLEQKTSDASIFFYENMLRTPAIVVKRDFYEKYGGFDPSFKHVADWDMWVRAISLSAGVAVNQPLAYYRLFPENDTNRLTKTGDNLRDCLLLAQRIETRYPGFSMNTFISHIRQRALAQAAFFMREQDQESTKFNAQLWWEMLSMQEKFKSLFSVLIYRDYQRLKIIKAVL